MISILSKHSCKTKPKLTGDEWHFEIHNFVTYSQLVCGFKHSFESQTVYKNISF